MEHADEQGGDRAQFAHLVAEHYRAEYEDLFGALLDLTRTPPHAGSVDDETIRAAWNTSPHPYRANEYAKPATDQPLSKSITRLVEFGSYASGNGSRVQLTSQTSIREAYSFLLTRKKESGD
jgi:hypothetical protein